MERGVSARNAKVRPSVHAAGAFVRSAAGTAAGIAQVETRRDTGDVTTIADIRAPAGLAVVTTGAAVRAGVPAFPATVPVTEIVRVRGADMATAMIAGNVAATGKGVAAGTKGEAPAIGTAVAPRAGTGTTIGMSAEAAATTSAADGTVAAIASVTTGVARAGDTGPRAARAVRTMIVPTGGVAPPAGMAEARGRRAAEATVTGEDADPTPAPGTGTIAGNEASGRTTGAVSGIGATAPTASAAIVRNVLQVIGPTVSAAIVRAAPTGIAPMGIVKGGGARARETGVTGRSMTAPTAIVQAGIVTIAAAGRMATAMEGATGASGQNAGSGRMTVAVTGASVPVGGTSDVTATIVRGAPTMIAAGARTLGEAVTTRTGVGSVRATGTGSATGPTGRSRGRVTGTGRTPGPAGLASPGVTDVTDVTRSAGRAGPRRSCRPCRRT
jgi:hypothetical protein